jgi:hypothetical protein
MNSIVASVDDWKIVRTGIQCGSVKGGKMVIQRITYDFVHIHEGEYRLSEPGSIDFCSYLESHQAWRDPAGLWYCSACKETPPKNLRIAFELLLM